MSGLFLTVLNMSLTASYVALVVMIIRLLIKNTPKVFSYALWAVVLFRLVSPISFESSFSLLHTKIEAIPQTILNPQISAINSGVGIVDNAVNQSTFSPVNLAASFNSMGVVMEVAAAIWLLGIAILLCLGAVSYLRLKHRLSTATLLKDNILETDRIQTPFVLGFFKPSIYVPSGLAQKEMSLILKHEQTHIKRLDYLIKPVAFLVLVLHWFNPLMWISYFLMAKDMEMSCDESVMKQSSEDIRASYSGSLLSLSAKQSGLLIPLAFGESNVKSRIKNVLYYKKPAFWVIIITVVVVISVAIGLMANPLEDASENSVITSIAWETINRDIAIYESNPDVSIIDSKITRLELLESFDVEDTPIDVYALEYRLLPEDLNKVVLAGGMDIDEDGWLKETASMGSPLLVISSKNGSIELIGILWTGGVIEDGGLELSIKALLKK